MIKMLKIEFLKLFDSFRFWVSILGVGMSLLLISLEVMRYGTVTTINDLFASVSGDMLICYILCIVGGGYGFCMEQKNHCVIYYVLRDKLAHYTLAKAIVSFIGGFLVSFLGSILGIIMMTAKIVLCNQCNGRIVDANGLEVMFAYIVGFSLLCGILSVLAMLISVFIVDYFIVMEMPILVYYMVLNITGWLSPPVWLDIRLTYFIRYDIEEFIWERFICDAGYAVLCSVCLVLAMYKIIKKGIERKIENG